MKKIVIILIAFVAMSASGQVTGKYAAEQFANPGRIWSSAAYPIEVGGENYAWQIYAKWDSLMGTSNYAKVQLSPDGEEWYDMAPVAPLPMYKTRDGAEPMPRTNIYDCTSAFLPGIRSGDSKRGTNSRGNEPEKSTRCRSI